MRLSFVALVFASVAFAQVRVEVTFPASLHAAAITGRAFVTFNPVGQQGPGFRMIGPFFGRDINGVLPGVATVIDGRANGYPILSLKDLPAGDYSVQAMICPYTEFRRADGHVIWAHMDQWEGQSPQSAPGNLYSAPQTVHVDAASSAAIRVALSQTIPPVNVPADTAYVKHVKIQSEMLTKFWGQPMYIGATVLLPRDYEQHPEQRYPAAYNVFHFSLGAPFGFSESAQNAFGKEWLSDNYPRAIAVTFQHPTPFYDDSYAANSPNHGPYGDALTKELIPYLEKQFRMIPEARARAVTGGSTGGWEALALQVYYPDVFGGAWVFCPDSIDFAAYQLINIYDDENAFLRPGVPSAPHPMVASEERTMLRTPDGQPSRTFREQTQYEDAVGGKSRSGGQLAGWDAVWSPVGDDGYPKPLWDHATGKIDKSVAAYMKEHGYDLARFVESRWEEIGPRLQGRLHFYVGDMDNWFANLAVYRMETLLKKLNAGATFTYGARQGHMWYPMSQAELVKMMVESSAR